MNPEILDADVFDDLQDSMGEDFVEDLVTTFLEEAPAIIAELREAASTGAADALRRAAHSLKSNAAAFGAARLTAEARRIEMNGVMDDGEIPRLEDVYTQTAAALIEWRDG